MECQAGVSLYERRFFKPNMIGFINLCSHVPAALPSTRLAAYPVLQGQWAFRELDWSDTTEYPKTSLIMLLEVLLTVAVAYIVYTFICLETNTRKARAMNVPFIRIPIDVHNVFWLIFQPLVWRILAWVPVQSSSWPDFVRFSRRGWHFQDKSRTHLRFGPVWALVTPVAVHLHFADPHAIQDIFSRRHDFVRPVEDYKLLEVYGPCLSTASFDDWPRHRKPLAAPFNESIMKFVWEQSLSQAGAMLRSWTGPNAEEAGIPSVQKDTRTLSLNVLAATGFRKSYNFHGSADKPVAGEARNYRDALQTVLDNVILLMLVPVWFLNLTWLPKSWTRLGQAATAFRKYMEQMLNDETRALREGKTGSGGIMTSLVHALAEHEKKGPEDVSLISKDHKKGLSVEEIYGNIFIINFAGHDTTANTLAFAMYLLAAHPEVQSWLSEEIAAITKDLPVEEWDYHTTFPQLKRCRAVLLETLRLYPPVVALPKTTSAKYQTLKVGDRMITIPPRVVTTSYLLAVQTHPMYWPEPYEWKPSRWILRGQGPSSDEELLVPSKGTYFPWSDGPQNCPGKKFAEVEFVAVLAHIFKTHRLSVKKAASESDQSARKRAIDCANNCNNDLLLRMVDADRLKLECKEL